MKSELKERLERLGPIPGITRVSSGSPVDLVVRPADGLAKVHAIDAIRSLAHRGMALADAKRAVEEMVVKGQARVHVPTVESLDVLATELLSAGVSTAQVGAVDLDVVSLREALGLTQEHFARRFALDLATLRS